MSRKDYEKAAALIRRMVANPEVNDLVTMEVMGAFIELFEGDNPRFDKDRFVKACMGVEVSS
jgi:hypothetical protein